MWTKKVWISLRIHTVWSANLLFVLFESCLMSQSTTMVMSRRSVNLPTLFLGRLRPIKAVYQYSVHILSPVTDNCLTWISRRERMAVEMITWPFSIKKCCRTGGSNPKNVAGPEDPTWDLLNTSWTRMWQRYWARPTYVVHCLDSIIHILAKFQISRLELVSVA